MKKIILTIIITTISTGAIAASAPTPSPAIPIATMAAITASNAAIVSANNSNAQDAMRKNLLSDTLVGHTVENCHIIDAYFSTDSEKLKVVCMNKKKNELYIKSVSNDEKKQGVFTEKIFELLREQFN